MASFREFGVSEPEYALALSRLLVYDGRSRRATGGQLCDEGNTKSKEKTVISDTLFDAIEDIRRYQQRMPEAYSNLRPQIDSVVRQMDLLKVYLDTPPVTAVEGIRWEALVRVHMALLENPYTPEPERELVRQDLLRLARIADGEEE